MSAPFGKAVVEFSLLGVGLDTVWVCSNCGACVINSDLHRSWHQAVLDAGIAKLQGLDKD